MKISEILLTGYDMRKMKNVIQNYTLFLSFDSLPKEEAEEPTHDNDEEKDNSSADIQNPEDYREIFQPRSRISRSPVRKVEPFPAPPEDGKYTYDRIRSHQNSPSSYH